MSEHKNLAEALAAFQGEVPTLHKQAEANAGSYSYKYVDLADIVEVIQPLMLKHGLSWSAFPCIAADGKPALRYKLSHMSGDCESEVMSLMLAKGDAQAHGSAITYARRYALCAVLNIVADKDDDGAAAKAAAERSRASGPTNGHVVERSPLADAMVERVTVAIKQARMPHDWLRMQLVALGVDEVPDGPIMRSTILSLTHEQAVKLIGLCDEVAASRKKAEEAQAK